MTSRPLVILGFIIIAIAVFAAIGYFVHGGGTGTAPSQTATTSVPVAPDAVSPSFYGSTTQTTNQPPSTYQALTASSTFAIPFPDSSTADTSSWQMYVDNRNGYTIEYPPDLVQGGNKDAPSFAFPKTYFHWPLLDDAKATITVAASCPGVVSQGLGGEGPDKFTMNGREFTRTVGVDIAAGNRYLEIAYDTTVSGKCYHLDFLDHGANGAGLYVDDLSLDKKYDAAHDADLAAVIAIWNGMAKNFHVLAQ